MSERYSQTPPGPDYFMAVGGDDDRAESTVRNRCDQGAEQVWQVAGESSADAGDKTPEFEI